MLLALLLPLLAFAADPLPVAEPTPAANVAMPGPPSPPSPEKLCEEAETKLHDFAQGLPSFCGHDNDCDAYSISPSSCTPPLVLRKNSQIAKNKDLKAFQAKATEACAAVWAKQPACAPLKLRPACREGRCVDGGFLPGAVK